MTTPWTYQSLKTLLFEMNWTKQVLALDNGLDVNTMLTGSGKTLLHLWCEYNVDDGSSATIVPQLLARGADVNANCYVFYSHDKQTPLSFAIRNAKVQTVKILLAANADASMDYLYMLLDTIHKHGCGAAAHAYRGARLCKLQEYAAICRLLCSHSTMNLDTFTFNNNSWWGDLEYHKNPATDCLYNQTLACILAERDARQRRWSPARAAFLAAAVL
jgi:ankyrin repeat protein